MKLTAMIPIRLGSTRFKMKNLSLMGGKPMAAYAIEAAIDSNKFDRIVVNSEDERVQKLAKDYGVEFYQRPEFLGGNTIKSDQVVADFMEKFPSDITCWVNTIAPLQSALEVEGAVDHFQKNNLESLITVVKEQVHAYLGESPVNFDPAEVFAQTQDLDPIYRMVYTVMMWKNSTFLEEYASKGFAFFCGRFGKYEVSKKAGLLVKTPEDYEIVGSYLNGRFDADQVEYYSV